MTRIEELNKEINAEIKVASGKYGRKNIHDYEVSRMALAVKKEITTRTNLQAAMVNYQMAAEQISDINTITCQHIVSRYHEMYCETSEFLGTVDDDIARALIDIGKHFRTDDILYSQILADIEVMEHYTVSANIMTEASCEQLSRFLDEIDAEAEEAIEAHKNAMHVRETMSDSLRELTSNEF